MSEKKCFEQFLEDVVAVSIYPERDCLFSLPPTIPRVREITLDTLNSPLLKVSMSPSEEEIKMEQPPVLSVSTSRAASGTTYTHDLQIVVSQGREQMEDVADQLKWGYFHVVYDCADGIRRLSYALPNTATADIEEKYGDGQTVTLKIKLQSLSPLINIVME